MLQQEMLQSTWKFQSFLQPDAGHSGVYGLNMDCDFDYSINTAENSYYPAILSTDHFSTFSSSDDDMQLVFPIENISQHMEGIEAISGTTLEDLLRWWGESEETGISSDDSMENEGVCSSVFLNSNESSIVSSPMNQSQVLPFEDMEVAGQTRLIHLLKAYGEAMEMGQRELANVIVGCINEKVSPVGEPMERVAFKLFQSVGNQGDYIRQESKKNFKAAFKAFYEIFPYGRFSHFAANSAILEAIMSDSGKVHIVDFDICEGVQWPPLIDAIVNTRKAIRLTSVRIDEQSYSFVETKYRLLDYASASGVKLEVQESTLQDLVREIQGSENHECLAFNCMVGLPHMGRIRDRSQVIEFLRVAKQLLLTNKGVITFGDGEDVERMKHCAGYSSFFDENLVHYQALCESMEANFPEHLTSARISMESLFVAPHVSSLLWYQNWENIREDYESKENIGLIGWRLSKESLMEAKEMVKERQSSYNVRVEGQNGNEMVLQWKGTPLVRVSAWK